MFEDSVNGQILEKGSINQSRLSYLWDVRLIKGHSVNLVNVSQLRDQGFSVIFNNDRCKVLIQKTKLFWVF